MSPSFVRKVAQSAGVVLLDFSRRAQKNVPGPETGILRKVRENRGYGLKTYSCMPYLFLLLMHRQGSPCFNQGYLWMGTVRFIFVYLPCPVITTQTVFNRILKSSQRDQLSIYSRSILTHC